MAHAKALTFLLLIVFIFLEFLMLAPEELEKGKTSQIETKTEVNEQTDQVMKGVHVIATRDERKEWELWAEEAIGIEKKGEWTLSKVKAIFFAEDGVSFNVKGNKGKFELASKNMRVSGDVRLISSNGYYLDTKEITYNSGSRILESLFEVNVTGPKESDGDYLIIRGDSMQIDLSDSLMQLLGNVKGKKALGKKQKVSVKSDKAHLSGKSYFVRFIHNVVLKLDDMKLSAPDVYFVYDNIRKKFTSLELSGGTKVSDNKKSVTAKNVKVFFDQQKYIFTGRPRVVQGGDELVGERIIFLDGGKRVKIEKAKAKIKKETLENRN